MIIEVSLYHESTGWFIISEPDGWPDAKLGFERHEDAFHCLVEFFRSNFRAYGTNGIEDGGRDKIKLIDRDYGPSTIIQLKIRIKDTIFDPFEDFYFGQIPIVALEEVIDEDHTTSLTFEQNDTWSKMISRLDVPVNIQSPTSHDGIAVDVIAPIDLPLTTQIIPKVYDSSEGEAEVVSGGGTTTGVGPGFPITSQFGSQYLQFSFLPEIDEAGQVYTLLTGLNNQLPAELIIPKDEGEYRITASVFIGIVKALGIVDGSGNRVYGTQDFIDEGNNVRDILRFFYQKNDEGPVEFNAVTRGVTTTTGARLSKFDLDVTLLNLKTNDAIRIYGKFNQEYEGFVLAPASASGIGVILYGKDNTQTPVYNLQNAPADDTINVGTPIVFDGGRTYSYLKIEAETTYVTTTSEAFLIHDIGRSILDRICDQNDTLFSSFLGNPYTSPAYPSTGCGSKNAGVKGLQVRGYSLSEKQFSISFKDWWEGLDPVYNLALWPVRDTITGKIKIHIGRKKDVYRTDSSSVTFSNVRKIGQGWDKQNLFNSYKNGYRQWESEDISGLDDPQAKQDRSNNLRNVGNKFESLSGWVAASLAIETTRRTRREKSADYKYDNETFLIALSRTDSGFTPELDENFNFVNGLINSSTRYNLRHTPARMFIRWMDFFSGALQTNPGNGFIFQGGEGNYNMDSELVNGDCDLFSEAVSERQNLPVSNNFLFIPRLFTFTTKLSLSEYKTIRENPNICILVSQTEQNHVPMLLKDVEFTPYTGEVTIKAWAKQWVDLKVVDEIPDPPRTVPRYFGPSFDLTFE